MTLNDRQDYFGQTVNIASRVQDLAVSQAIYATGAIINNPQASTILANSGITPASQMAALRGIDHDVQVFVVP